MALLLRYVFVERVTLMMRRRAKISRGIKASPKGNRN
jgi:hypothetical protein